MSQDNPKKSANETASLESIATNIIELDTLFIGIPTEPLNQGYIKLLTHAPSNDGLDDYACEMASTDVITVDGNEFGFLGIEGTLHSNVHFQKRLPLYSSSNSAVGTPDISLEEGIETFREYRHHGHAPTPPKAPVALETLVDELINEGAVAVSLQKELVRVGDDPHLPFRAHMPPVNGNLVDGRYETISVKDNIFNFSIEPVLRGPEFFDKVPVYADDTIIGLDPVSQDRGIQNVQNYLADST